MERDEQPVSPGGRMLDTRELSICVHLVGDLESLVDPIHAKKAATDIWLPKHPRLSCILKEDENGKAKWIKTNVDVSQHIIFPTFPNGLENYDEMVEEYISDLHLRELQRDRPLWEFHFINYPTKSASATCIFTAHHLLGDGASFLSLFQACSDTPLTIPPLLSKVSRSPESSMFIIRWLQILWYTIVDLVSDFWILNVMTDTDSPLRGPPQGCKYLPKVFASSFFQLDDIKLVKEASGGTVNDVLVGIVFSGLQRYIREILIRDHVKVDDVEREMKKMRITILALMNGRADKTSKPLEEMKKTKSSSPWGNKSGFVAMRVPMESLFSPLDYVKRAKSVMDRKKISRAALVTGKALHYYTMIKGPKGASKALNSFMKRATLAMSNIAGPSEPFRAVNTTAKSACFSWSGGPQGLVMGALSFAGQMRVQVTGTKGIIDVKLLAECLSSSFEDMKREAIFSSSFKKFM